jgi:hypothetical protein
VHLQDGDTIDPSANFEDRSDSGDSSGSEDPVEDRSDSGDSSGSEDPSDSGDSSGSKDPSDSEEHSALFEVAEEILEWPTQPDDLSFDQDYSSEDTDQMEDTAGMEDSALFEALEESSRTIKLNTSLPEAVVQLQEKLLGDYNPPSSCGYPSVIHTIYGRRAVPPTLSCVDRVPRHRESL